MDGLAEPRRTDVGGQHAHHHSHSPGSGPQGPSKSNGTLRSETKGQAAACPDRTQAIPCKVRESVTRIEERRAISMQLDRVTSGQSRAVEAYEIGWSTGVTGDDLSNSQADSPTLANLQTRRGPTTHS